MALFFSGRAIGDRLGRARRSSRGMDGAAKVAANTKYLPGVLIGPSKGRVEGECRDARVLIAAW